MNRRMFNLVLAATASTLPTTSVAATAFRLPKSSPSGHTKKAILFTSLLGNLIEVENTVAEERVEASVRLSFSDSIDERVEALVARHVERRGATCVAGARRVLGQVGWESAQAFGSDLAFLDLRASPQELDSYPFRAICFPTHVDIRLNAEVLASDSDQGSGAICSNCQTGAGPVPAIRLSVPEKSDLQLQAARIEQTAVFMAAQSVIRVLDRFL